ncbi:MAG: site-specific integrase, partial [Candidatus Heimdallarchaeota archaeon]|nr:site-specific integrase [Candidatus Heimdallarchaeota archaeon]
AHFTMSTGIQVRVHDWDKKSMRIKGASPEVYANNSQMDSIRLKVLQIVNQLTVLGRPFNINTIKKTLEGNETNQITLMRICNEQIKEMEKLRGKDYAPATIIKYKNTILRLRQFLKYKFKRSDVYLYELNYYFISEFEAFLKHKYDNSTTTCYKHYQRLTRMIRQAMHKGYLEKYPFENYKIRMPKKKIEYLTQEEINRIEQKEFSVSRLNTIRDIFIFCCYTGLAYAEVESLAPENITTGMDGDLWLNIHRKKTNKDYQVPLLPKSLDILEKYKNHPICLKRGRCLPVPSNVKYNAYLKEVGDMAGIPNDKPLVSHLARKTFACTIGLANGMNIGVLSKILGHASIQVTLDSYATVIDELMLSNVRDLKDKLSSCKERFTITEYKGNQNAQNMLIDKAKKTSRN